MLISLFAAMSMLMNAEVIEYTTDDSFYYLDTEEKTAEFSVYWGSAKEIVIPESVTYENVVYKVTSLGEECFYKCSTLISIDIPSSVTSIGKSCFQGCSSLTSITIPFSVTSLGDVCFGECTSLKSIDIPSSVTSLGKCCFAYCPSLTSINIPSSSSLTSLGDRCFEYCFSLTSINIPSSVISLGYSCFNLCSSLKTMTCEISTPITISGYDIFVDTPINEATLYVPVASLKSYRTTYPWSGFGTILPLGSSGIESHTIGTVADVKAVYGLDGKRCDGMKSGMNIIRMSDGTTRKIVK